MGEFDGFRLERLNVDGAQFERASAAVPTPGRAASGAALSVTGASAAMGLVSAGRTGVRRWGADALITAPDGAARRMSADESTGAGVCLPTAFRGSGAA